MRKSDKKIEKQLTSGLNEVCEQALQHIEGFQWLTHRVNYAKFPDSLRVVCVFETKQQREDYLQSPTKDLLASLVQMELKRLGLEIKSVARHLNYDSEEACNKQHHGNWALRLDSLKK